MVVMAAAASASSESGPRLDPQSTLDESFKAVSSGVSGGIGPVKARRWGTKYVNVMELGIFRD